MCTCGVEATQIAALSSPGGLTWRSGASAGERDADHVGPDQPTVDAGSAGGGGEASGAARYSFGHGTLARTGAAGVQVKDTEGSSGQVLHSDRGGGGVLCGGSPGDQLPGRRADGSPLL